MGGKIDEAATGNEIPKVSGPKKKRHCYLVCLKPCSGRLWSWIGKMFGKPSD